MTYLGLRKRIRKALGEDPVKRSEGLVAKIYQSLRPHIAEMFFTRIPILVEGLEDESYISNHLHVTGKWSEFRRLGYHFIPVNGKDKLIQPRAIAKELHILCFVIFDADSDTTRLEHQVKHERDNLALMTLIGCKKHAFPDTPVLGADHAIWPTNLTTLNEEDVGSDCVKFKDIARNHYAQEGGLEKQDLFIAVWISQAYESGKKSTVLTEIRDSILACAK